MSTAALVVLQTLLLVALAPLWNGVVGRIKARLQMRRGLPVLQRYRDLFKLAGKETVLSEHASPLARVAPYMVVGGAVALCTWTPVLTTLPGLGFAGDLVMTVALLAVMRVLLALLALEAGTTFGGMAASRHLALSALAEPALMLAVFTLAYLKVGGEGHFAGSIVGAALLTLLAQYALGFGAFEHVFYGGAIVLVVLLMPEGIVGRWAAWRARRAGAAHARGPEA